MSRYCHCELSLESVASICHWWGVSRWTVQRWRRALGVGWYTPGTQAAWSEATKKRLTTESRRKGAEMSHAAKGGKKTT